MFGWLPSSFKGGTSEKSGAKEKRGLPRELVKVVVVHSHTGGKKMWEFLEKNWQECGTVKLALSHQRDFTLASLVEANPDVIICSDPAGAPYQYTTQEVDDLVEFLENSSGKHILGTYASFYHQEGNPTAPHIYDNRKLARLFGFDPSLSYTTKKLSMQPKYFATDEYKECTLWNKLSLPFTSWGYSSTQTPAVDGTSLPWLAREDGDKDEDDEDNVLPQTKAADERLRSKGEHAVGLRHELHVMAHSRDGQCVITNFIAPTFTSMYISHMPEYESLKRSHDDAQFLYNAVLYLQGQSSTHSLKELCVTTLASALFMKGFQNRAAVCGLPLNLQLRLCQAALKHGQSEKKVVEMFGKEVMHQATAASSSTSSQEATTTTLEE